MSSSGSIPLTPITSIDSMNSPFDKVVPTEEQTVAVSEYSKRIWNGHLEKASFMFFNSNTIILTILAKHCPKLPDEMEGVTHLVGYARWHPAERFNSAAPNAMHDARRAEKRRWSLLKLYPTLFEISLLSNFNFEGCESNGIAFLFLAWSYILSVFTLEKLQIPVRYRDVYAQWGDGAYTGGAFFIQLGDASDEEFRWWAALVHPGQGWAAAYSSQPVWAVTMTEETRFVVLSDRDSIPPGHVNPPSSREALGFLCRFAARFGLEDQVPLALAMALTIPLHGSMSSTIQLPKPRLVEKQGVSAPTPSFTSAIEEEFRNLSYYIVLSSNPTFVASALWSVFWEPEIDCNLVSPWCNAAISVIKPLIEGNHMETLGHVLAHRRPDVAALWYGLVACGNSEIISSIIPYLETLHTPLPVKHVPEVSVWTDTPQSFMDLAGSGPYLQGNQIAREDLWRLRHEACNTWKGGVHFRHLPTTPFRPFGSVDAEEVEVAVRPHLDCPRHEWVYSGFTWILPNGIELTHEPRVLTSPWTRFEPEPYINLPPARSGEPASNRDHAASKYATGNMFRWSATEMEESGKHIYSHPWVNVDAHLAIVEQEKRRPEGVVRVSDMDRVKQWVVNNE